MPALLPRLALALAIPATAFAAEPIRIGVIAENSAISGIAIPNAAQSPPTRSTPMAASTAA